jgi:hypothetical protein
VQAKRPSVEADGLLNVWAREGSRTGQGYLRLVYLSIYLLSYLPSYLKDAMALASSS